MKLKILAAAIVVAASLTGCNSDDNGYDGYVAQVAKPEKITEFRNVVYASYMKEANDMWFTNPDHSNEISDLNIAFMNPDANKDEQGIFHPDGHVSELSEANDQRLTETIANFRNQNPNGRVFISFGGWRDSEKDESDDGIIGRDIVYEKIAANPTYRDNLIDDIMNVVSRYQFDGVDLDWEYPSVGDVASQYADFVNRLADRLHSEGKYFTAAIIGGEDKPTDDGNGAGYLDVALDAFDTVHLMTYDMQDEDHSTYADTLAGLNYWLEQRHLDPQRVTLGLPAYTRHGPTYGKMIQLDPESACRDMVADDNGEEGHKIHYYNGLPTIRSKVHFAMDKNLGGVMLWELPCDEIHEDYEDSSIIITIHEEIAGNEGYQNVCDQNPDWIEYREDDPMPHFVHN